MPRERRFRGRLDDELIESLTAASELAVVSLRKALEARDEAALALPALAQQAGGDTSAVTMQTSPGKGTLRHERQIIATVEAVDENPLTTLPAFKTFQRDLKERCAEPPQAAEATIVGNYRMLGER